MTVMEGYSRKVLRENPSRSLYLKELVTTRIAMGLEFQGLDKTTMVDIALIGNDQKLFNQDVAITKIGNLNSIEGEINGEKRT